MYPYQTYNTSMTHNSDTSMTPRSMHSYTSAATAPANVNHQVPGAAGAYGAVTGPSPYQVQPYGQYPGQLQYNAGQQSYQGQHAPLHGQSQQLPAGPGATTAAPINYGLGQAAANPAPGPNQWAYGLSPGVVVNKVDLDRLHAAIQSLYEDRIFPSELTVKARLKTTNVSHHLLQNFVSVYSSLPFYTVGKVPRSGNQIAILLKHGFEGFKGWVDATSDEDCYPPELWDKFEEYLKELVKLRSTQRHCPISFHRGRYGMSVELAKQKLGFFKDRTLGEVCHIVELAIQKKLLLYENNMLLPALACDSLTNAMHGKPTATAGCHHPHHESEYIQTMDDLKAILYFLLDNYPEGFNLSTLKTKIRNVFGKRLSETVFHQTKLLDLIQLSPLDQIVTVVKLEGNCGYLCTANRAVWSIWKAGCQNNSMIKHNTHIHQQVQADRDASTTTTSTCDLN